MNQGQLDRWHIVATLNYLEHDREVEIVLSRQPEYASAANRESVSNMVMLAGLTRTAFMHGDLSTVMSPRTVISWAENARIFGDIATAFRLTFLNKCDDAEKPLVAEYFQRCFDQDLPLAQGNAALY